MITYIYILLLTCFLCLYRMAVGPTPPDRTVAMDILGTILVGFCALMTVITDQDWYLNIAISWALLSFVGTLAVAKFIEGRGLHE